MKPKLPAYLFLPVILGVVLTLSSCPNLLKPMSSATDAAGSLTGHAFFSGESDNSGIIISAESTDGVKSLTVQRMLAGAADRDAKAIAVQTTTDAGGAYALSGLMPGTYVVTASSKDTLEKAVSTSVKVVAGQSTQVVVLCLTLTGQISGTATLSDAASPNWSLGIVVFIAGTSYSAMTAADGSYTISGVPPGKNYTLVASKVGYDSAITSVDVKVCHTTPVASFSLQKSRTSATSGSISGTAQLNDGSMNAGIFVYLLGTSCITVTGDDTGAFSLTGVAQGTYTLVASKEGYTSASVSEVNVYAGDNTAVATTLILTAIPCVLSSPMFSPSTGTFSIDQTVTIYEATPGATIYFTMATGATPPDPSIDPIEVYSSPIQVKGDGTVTIIKAIAAKAGMTTSSVAQSTYTIDYGANAAYIVTYNGNGATNGTVPTDGNNYRQGATVTVLGNAGTLVKTGSSFAGWNMRADGNGTAYAPGATFIMGAAHVTLYAAWTPAPGNADLSSLVPSEGSLSPVFDSATTGYTDSVANSVSGIRFTPTAADAGSTILVNGTPVTSGQQSGLIAVTLGANAVSVVVTAENGTTTKTYTVVVNRARLSSNASLASLVPSQGSLFPPFNPTTTSYTEYVGYSVSSISFTPTTQAEPATIQVNGYPVTSGQQSVLIDLTEGANVVNVVVTAGDGTTIKTYTVTVNKTFEMPSLSGTIFGTGTISATSPLYVTWRDLHAGYSDTVKYTDGSFPRNYSWDSMADGSYSIGAFLDANNDGEQSSGDSFGQSPPVTMSGASVTGIDFTIRALAGGTLTVVLNNAAASNWKYVYFSVFPANKQPASSPVAGLGYFTIVDGTGSSQTIDTSLNPLNPVTFAGGFYTVFILIDVVGKTVKYPPTPADLAPLYDTSGQIAGQATGMLDGNSTIYIDYGNLKQL